MASSQNPDLPKPRGGKPPRAGMLVRWENGHPLPVYNPPTAKNTLEAMLVEAECEIYNGETDPETGEQIFDARYVGQTKAQVAIHRLLDQASAGYLPAIKEYLDRKFGKPKQSIEQVSMNVTYQDFLDSLKEEDSPDEVSEAIDAQFHSNFPDIYRPEEVEEDEEDLDTESALEGI